ncbi:hypothetical protein VINI7043_13960 [Vibrio nigripulchritudo ATCC 27043]|nr:hypothetical protein VINI7043_13960 [Vibrio nigripulchritudo ATCC 27043]
MSTSILWYGGARENGKHNKKFKQTKNAWHFQLALSIVFTVVCIKRVGAFLAA